jgi:hypothetical protein
MAARSGPISVRPVATGGIGRLRCSARTTARTVSPSGPRTWIARVESPIASRSAPPRVAATIASPSSETVQPVATNSATAPWQPRTQVSPDAIVSRTKARMSSAVQAGRRNPMPSARSRPGSSSHTLRRQASPPARHPPISAPVRPQPRQQPVAASYSHTPMQGLAIMRFSGTSRSSM